MLGGLGTGEIILIAIAVLVLFGAKKLPEIGKSLGKGLREFKKATNEISAPLKEGMDEATNVIEQPPITADAKIDSKIIENKSDDSTKKV